VGVRHALGRLSRVLELLDRVWMCSPDAGRRTPAFDDQWGHWRLREMQSCDKGAPALE
jgi:hypothetical protein